MNIIIGLLISSFFGMLFMAMLAYHDWLDSQIISYKREAAAYTLLALVPFSLYLILLIFITYVIYGIINGFRP